jgi:hypothetical protein
MGIEVAIGAIAAAASVVTGVMSLNSAKAAGRERKEANKVATAQQQNENAEGRRKAVREARVRRAMIMQQSENAGLGVDGSGTQGAMGVVNTNIGSRVASAAGQTRSIETINAHNQRASDLDFKSGAYTAFGNIFSTALGSFQQKQPKQPSYEW